MTKRYLQIPEENKILRDNLQKAINEGNVPEPFNSIENIKEIAKLAYDGPIIIAKNSNILRSFVTHEMPFFIYERKFDNSTNMVTLCSDKECLIISPSCKKQYVNFILDEKGYELFKDWYKLQIKIHYQNFNGALVRDIDALKHFIALPGTTQYETIDFFTCSYGIIALKSHARSCSGGDPIFKGINIRLISKGPDFGVYAQPPTEELLLEGGLKLNKGEIAYVVKKKLIIEKMKYVCSMTYSNFGQYALPGDCESGKVTFPADHDVMTKRKWMLFKDELKKKLGI